MQFSRIAGKKPCRCGHAKTSQNGWTGTVLKITLAINPVFGDRLYEADWATSLDLGYGR
jgi:hypothetical protein